MKAQCSFCNIEYERKTKPVTQYNYCNVSCQMKNEYKLGIRDPIKITKAAQKVAHKKQKKHNWLNTKKSRDRLREVKKTPEDRLKCSLAKRGNKNPMYGREGELSPQWKGHPDKTYLGSIKWRRIRKLVKIRDGFICQSCKLTEREALDKFGQVLQVHHLIPYVECKEHKENNLITLCNKCHGLCKNYDFNERLMVEVTN
jgi:5-methylcytosine-specific restriction endonuclease McrA